jgi:hypothetical protein
LDAQVQPKPARTRSRLKLFVGISSIAALVVIVAVSASGGNALSGIYTATDGAGTLEFRGNKVYVTSSLGTTFVSTYEIDGNRIVIKGTGGAQVFTRDGPTLDAGAGMKYVKTVAGVP